MSRSRSSFDLTNAIATANTLASTSSIPPRFPGAPLVSFEGAPPAANPSRDRSAQELPPPARVPQGSSGSATRPEVSSPGSNRPGPAQVERTALPPLPDLGGIDGPIHRCELIIDWIGEATGAKDIFLADASGLPVAGQIEGAEERHAASGVVATAVRALLPVLPGVPRGSFEMHLGDGPVFQLIGFAIHGAQYMVGLTREAPLTVRQTQAIRLACGHALESLAGTAT